MDRPFTVLPGTLLTTAVAVSHAGDHKTLHVQHLLLKKPCPETIPIRTVNTLTYNIISFFCFSTPIYFFGARDRPADFRKIPPPLLLFDYGRS